MIKKLNILCCNPDGGAFLYITRGWEDAFRSLGHSFLRWNGSGEQFRQFKPDIYLGCSGWRQIVPPWAKQEFGTKIGIHVNPWGSTVLKALPGEPDINESLDARKWTIAQKPDFLYCYGFSADIAHMWDQWTIQYGVPVIPMPTAGNSIIHQPAAISPNHVCDVGFIGGKWPYKSMNIDKFLVPVLKEFKSIIYGWGGWQGFPQWRGPGADGDVNTLFSSAKVCPSIVEPHTTRYGIDIPERMFKVALGGGFTICDPVANLGRVVNLDNFPMADSIRNYRDLVHHYIINDDFRNQRKKLQRIEILTNHTYLNRIQNVLRVCGYPGQAEQAQQEVVRRLNEMV